MKRPVTLAVAAVAIVALYAGLRALGAAEHTAVLVGMPSSTISLLVGPLFVVAMLAAVVVAPILAIAAAIDAGLGRLRR